MAPREQGDVAPKRRSLPVRAFAVLRTVVIVPLFFVATLGFAMLVIVLSFLRRDSPLIDRTIRVWSRLFLLVAPATLEVEGRHHIEPGHQYVFVANHLSNFDVPVMFLATPPASIRFLAKKEVYKIPLVAQAMNAIGIIKTDRGAGGRAHAFINEGVQAAKARGHSLIIFPEGTRSDDGRLASFRKGAFRIAVSSDLPVVPVTIEGTWDIWPPGAKVFYSGHAKATIHEPIPTHDLALTDIARLTRQAQAAVAGPLGEETP